MTEQEARQCESFRAAMGEYAKYAQMVWTVLPDATRHIVKHAVCERAHGSPPYTVLANTRKYDPEQKAMVVTLRPWNGRADITVPVKEVSLKALAFTGNA